MSRLEGVQSCARSEDKLHPRDIVGLRASRPQLRQDLVAVAAQQPVKLHHVVQRSPCSSQRELGAVPCLDRRGRSQQISRTSDIQSLNVSAARVKTLFCPARHLQLLAQYLDQLGFLVLVLRLRLLLHIISPKALLQLHHLLIKIPSELLQGLAELVRVTLALRDAVERDFGLHLIGVELLSKRLNLQLFLVQQRHDLIFEMSFQRGMQVVMTLLNFLLHD
mmetsp:Transcript_428/g.942  ORF Transcript_428/g.942 Transcript_428/m.942 type:complete len:221 (+) Transcript_428:1015-1677(+)